MTDEEKIEASPDAICTWVVSVCWLHKFYSEGEHVRVCPECEKEKKK